LVLSSSKCGLLTSSCFAPDLRGSLSTKERSISPGILGIAVKAKISSGRFKEILGLGVLAAAGRGRLKLGAHG